MPGLILTLFGAPRIELDDHPVRVERQKALALLSFLAVTQKPHRRDKLAALLWPDLDQNHARAALRRTLSSLNHSIRSAWLLSVDSTIALCAQAGFSIDVIEFRRLLALAGQADESQEIGLLEAAIELYNDDFMSGFSLPDSPDFEEWQRSEAESLRQELAMALAQLSAKLAAQGDYARAIHRTQRWVNLDPLQEAAQQRLISLYLEAGELHAAHRQYALYAQTLEEEVGVRIPTVMTDHFGATLPVHPAPFTRHATTRERTVADEVDRERSLSVRLLGQFDLRSGDRPIALNQPRLQALLAYLLLHRQSPQSRQHLAFLFWPDTGEEQALTDLRNLLHKLRHALPAGDRFIRADAQTVQWQANTPIDFDVERFDLLAEKKDDIAALRKAADDYAGDLMPSCYAEWIEPERVRLQQKALVVFDRLIDLLETGQEYLTAIGYAKQLIRLDPLNESGYRRLMQLWALKGDQAAALRVYRACEQTLQRELGTSPGPAIQALFQRLCEIQPPPPKTDSSHAAPLIGRNDEWKLLQRLWHRAAGGMPQCVVLAGEAGIGKTRLAEELMLWLTRQGHRTAVAHCYAAEGALAYAPLLTWLRSPSIQSSISALDPIWLGELVRLLPELQTTHPDLAPPTAINQPWQRQRMFEALAHAVLQDNRPLLLFLDDLQWSDQDTLEWLHFLLRWDQKAPLLLLTAMRSEEVTRSHAVSALLMALDKSNQLTEIVLGGLNADATAEVGSAVAGRPLSAREAEHIYRETEGNPLFVVETVRAGMGDSAELVETPAAHALPPKVQTVIRSRLHQLTPHAHALATLAATIGREISLAVLARASDLDEERLVECIDELLERRILRDKGGNLYDFSHDKLREVAYNGLSAARRKFYHRHVAQALEQIYASHGLDRVSAQIAHHFEMTEQMARSAAYYRRAAIAAQRLYANGDALRYYQRALVLLANETDADTLLMLIHEEMGDVYRLQGDYPAAEESYQHALSLARAIDRARVVRKIGTLERDQRKYDAAQITFDAAIQMVDEARRLQPETDEEWQRACWQEWLSIQLDRDTIYYWLGQVEESAALLAATQPALAQWGDSQQQATFYQRRALMAFRRNHNVCTPAILADARASLIARQSLGFGQQIVAANFLFGFLLLWSDDPEAAEQQLRISLRMAERTGDIALQARCATYLAVADRQLNQINSTRRYVELAFAAAMDAQMPEYIATAHANRSWLAWRAGQWQQAEDDARAALELWQQLPATHASLPFKWTALWPLIDVLHRRGDYAAATAHLATLAGPDQRRLPDLLSTAVNAVLEERADVNAALLCKRIDACITLAQQLRFL